MAFYGMMKAHHGYMKGNALRELNAVTELCQCFGIEPIAPRREHWHGIENAAALMIEKMSDEQRAMLPAWIRKDHLLHSEILKEAHAEFSQPSKRANQ